MMLEDLILLAAAAVLVWTQERYHGAREEADRLRAAGEFLVDAVHGLDFYAALGGAPIERTERADDAVWAWRRLVEAEPAPSSHCTCPPGTPDDLRHEEGCPCRRGGS